MPVAYTLAVLETPQQLPPTLRIRWRSEAVRGAVNVVLNSKRAASAAKPVAHRDPKIQEATPPQERRRYK